MAPAKAPPWSMNLQYHEKLLGKRRTNASQEISRQEMASATFNETLCEEAVMLVVDDMINITDQKSRKRENNAFRYMKPERVSTTVSTTVSTCPTVSTKSAASASQSNEYQSMVEKKVTYLEEYVKELESSQSELKNALCEKENTITALCVKMQSLSKRLKEHKVFIKTLKEENEMVKEWWHIDVAGRDETVKQLMSQLSESVSKNEKEKLEAMLQLHELEREQFDEKIGAANRKRSALLAELCIEAEDLRTEKKKFEEKEEVMEQEMRDMRILLDKSNLNLAVKEKQLDEVHRQQLITEAHLGKEERKVQKQKEKIDTIRNSLKKEIKEKKCVTQLFEDTVVYQTTPRRTSYPKTQTPITRMSNCASTTRYDRRRIVGDTIKHYLGEGYNEDDVQAMFKALSNDPVFKNALNVVHNRMSARQDAAFCAKNSIRPTTRTEMIKDLKAMNIPNIFSQTTEFIEFRKENAVSENYVHEEKTIMVKDKEKQKGKGKDAQVGKKVKVTEMKDVKGAVTRRLQHLMDSGQLILKPDQHELMLTIIGDKGGTDTKLGLCFGDVEKSCSVQNILLVGLYDGEDNWEHLNQVFPNLVKQINELKTVILKKKSLNTDSETEPSEEIEFNLEKFLTGDVKFICSCYGHKGGAAKEYCPGCDTTKIPLVKYRNHSLLGNEAEYDEDGTKKKKKKCITSRKVMKRTLDSMKKNAVRGKWSMKQEPIFEIEPDHIIPPSLHIIMGVFGKLWERVKEIIHQIALGDGSFNRTEKTVKDLNKKIRNKAEQVSQESAEISALQKELLDYKIIRSILYKQDNNVFDTAQEQERECDSMFCVINDQESTQHSGGFLVSWAQCSACKKDYHHLCDAIVTEEEKLEASDAARYKCKACSAGITTRRAMLKYIDEAIQHMKETIAGKHNDYKKLVESHGKMKEVVDKKGGTLYEDLLKVLKEVGADPRAYFGEFTGNQIRNILTNNGPAKICALLRNDNNKEEVEKLQKCMELLGIIQGFAVARTLKDEEIDQFEKNVKEFFTLLEEAYPSCSFTPKMHLLYVHVPLFMREHKTWGITSEQIIEAFHALWNKMLRVHASVKSNYKVQRDRCLNDLNQLNLYNDYYKGRLS